MTTKRFIRIHISATSNEDYLIEDLYEGAENDTEEQIEAWLDENAWELLEDDDWLCLDVDTRMFEREVAE